MAQKAGHQAVKNKEFSESYQYSDPQGLEKGKSWLYTENIFIYLPIK